MERAGRGPSSGGDAAFALTFKGIASQRNLLTMYCCSSSVSDIPKLCGLGLYDAETHPLGERLISACGSPCGA